MTTKPQDTTAELTDAEAVKALQAAVVAKSLKRYGMLTIAVLGQVALGAAGAALLLKFRDRSSTKTQALGHDTQAS
jgi:hypothetical protein